MTSPTPKVLTEADLAGLPRAVSSEEATRMASDLQMDQANTWLASDMIHNLVSERDSLCTAFEQVRQDCHNLTEKVIPNIRSERDALAGRVAELEAALWGCIAAIERTHHCTEADRLAAADKARAALSATTPESKP